MSRIPLPGHWESSLQTTLVRSYVRLERHLASLDQPLNKPLNWAYVVIHKLFSKLTVVACRVVTMTRENPLGRPEDLVPESAPLSKSITDVDDALLAEAQLLLGIITESDTVNLALAGLITEHRRASAVESQLRRYQAGQFTSIHHTFGG